MQQPSKTDLIFENNWRRQQEIKGRVLIDVIYNKLFSTQNYKCMILRNEREDADILDKHFAIDVQIKTLTGLILVGQEKVLSNEFVKFKSLTIEHYQNWRTMEIGDWYKMAVQFYFVGYLNKEKTGFEIWVLVNWANIVKRTFLNEIKWIEQQNKKEGAKASFKYCHFDSLPPDCIMYSSLVGA